jgi:hypothetical protein
LPDRNIIINSVLNASFQIPLVLLGHTLLASQAKEQEENTAANFSHGANL